MRMKDLLDRPPSRYGDTFDQIPARETPEMVLERAETFKVLKAIIARFPTRRMKLVTSITFDAAYYGEELSAAELQEILSEQYGEEMSINNIYQTRQRGMTRLVKEITAMLDAETAEEQDL
jgi:hypothetical protein